MMYRRWGSSLIVLVLLLGGAVLPGRTPASAAGTQSGWQILNPLSPTADMGRIVCPDRTTCYATAQNGTIVQTHNSGRTWTSRQVGTSNQFQSLSCPAVAICFVAAGKATVFSTTNSGATWHQRTNVTSYRAMGITNPGGDIPPIVDMACPGPTICYAPVGFATGRSATYLSFIAVTADAGRTWQTRKITTREMFAPESITCPAVRTCFMGGLEGIILLTRDGGHSWTSHKSGANGTLMRVTCSSVTICLAAPNDPEVGLVRTSDGGATWTAQPRPLDERYVAVSCPSTKLCYRVGSFDVTVSSDGGRTWKTPIRLSGNWLSDIACPTASTCHVVGQYGTTFRTDNGGGTWRSETRGSTSLLTSIACPATSTCYAAGDTGTMLKTTDGSTWVAQTTRTNDPFTGIACPGPTTCHAVQRALTGSSGGVWGTGDGATWHRQMATPDLFGVACPSMAACFAVGAGSRIYATGDGGQTWTRLPAGSGAPPLLGIACGSTEMCIAVGGSDMSCGDEGGCSAARGMIVRTADGGKTWQRSGLKKKFLTGIACPDARTCYVVGVNYSAKHSPAAPLVMVTQDAGLTWHDVGPPPSANRFPLRPRAIACTSVSACYVVAGENLLGTSNGGHIWSNLGSPWPRAGSGARPATPNDPELQAVACPAAQTCYVVGPGGLIAVNRHLAVLRKAG